MAGIYIKGVYLFIVFEGTDGAGKTTQANLLHSYLRKEGVKSVLTKEPTDGIMGSLIHKALYELDKPLINDKKANLMALQLLFVADRAEHIYNYIIPEQKSGNVVISDRYVLSTVAYGIASGLDKRWLIELNKYFPEPDLTILIDVKPKNAITRLSRRAVTTEYFEKLKFIERSRKAYLQLRHLHDNCFVIDGNMSKEENASKISKIVESKLQRKK